MTKQDTIADIIFPESTNFEIGPTLEDRFNFTNIKEIRIGDFVYKNPNITIERTTNERYESSTMHAFRRFILR